MTIDNSIVINPNTINGSITPAIATHALDHLENEKIACSAAVEGR